MIATELVLAGVGAVVAICVAYYKSIPCNHCKYLVMKGGGLWRYTCKKPNHYEDHFDMAPRYCKYFEEVSDD